MTEKFKWLNNFLYYEKTVILYVIEYTSKWKIYKDLVYNSGIAILLKRSKDNYYGTPEEVIENVERDLYVFARDFLFYYKKKYNIE